MKIDFNSNIQSQSNSSGINPEIAKANKANNSVFQIDVNTLDDKTKQFWNTKNYDVDGDGLVSEGDFDNNTLNLSNGSQKFKEFISDLFGKAWDVAGTIIDNLKAMFIKSNPNYTDTAKIQEKERNDAISKYVKDNKIKPGEFDFNGQRYNLGENGTIVGALSNTQIKTEEFGNGVVSKTSWGEGNSNTDIYNKNGEFVGRREEYDNGSAYIKVYNDDGTKTEINLRAPKTAADKPHINILNRK